MANPAPKIIIFLTVSLSLFVDHPTHVHRFFCRFFFVSMFVSGVSVSVCVSVSHERATVYQGVLSASCVHPSEYCV